jgi:hypothetical protein
MVKCDIFYYAYARGDPGFGPELRALPDLGPSSPREEGPRMVG